MQEFLQRLYDLVMELAGSKGVCDRYGHIALKKGLELFASYQSAYCHALATTVDVRNLFKVEQS